MDVKLDNDTWDLVIEDGDLVLTTGQEAIKQHLKQRLLTFLTEWFLDQGIGIPYFQQVLVKNPDPVVLDSVFIKEIINTPGIIELTEFNLDLTDDRKLTLNFKARTTDGVLDFSEVLPI